MSKFLLLWLGFATEQFFYVTGAKITYVAPSPRTRLNHLQILYRWFRVSATQASPKIIFFFPGSLCCFRTARAGTLPIIAGHNGLLNLPKSIKSSYFLGLN